ncbi:MAG: hypothetical protein ACOYML_13225 [Microthrixaceae bacterium]
MRPVPRGPLARGTLAPRGAAQFGAAGRDRARWTYYLAVAVWLLGDLSVVDVSVVTAKFVRRPDLLGAALLSPLYWVLMSIAAVRAAVQLVTAPSHWEKTTHGLTLGHTHLPPTVADQHPTFTQG